MKYCPVQKTNVLYLECQDCDDRNICHQMEDDDEKEPEKE